MTVPGASRSAGGVVLKSVGAFLTFGVATFKVVDLSQGDLSRWMSLIVAAAMESRSAAGRLVVCRDKLESTGERLAAVSRRDSRVAD